MKTENVRTNELSNDFQAKSYFLQQDKWTYFTNNTKACTHPELLMYVSSVQFSRKIWSSESVI